MPLRRLTMPSAMRVLGLLASVRALQFTPTKKTFQLRSSAETELTIDPIAVTTESEYAAGEMAPDVAVEKAELSVLYLRSLGVCGGFTPSTRVVSRREGGGWSLFRF